MEDSTEGDFVLACDWVKSQLHLLAVAEQHKVMSHLEAVAQVVPSVVMTSTTDRSGNIVQEFHDVVVPANEAAALQLGPEHFSELTELQCAEAQRERATQIEVDVVTDRGASLNSQVATLAKDTATAELLNSDMRKHDVHH